MTALRQILVATDFSASARHAADRAARIAHETGARLELLHVLPGQSLQALRQWLGSDHASERQLHADVEDRLGQQAAELQRTRRVDAACTHRGGPVIDDIVARAQDLDADLLVLGARGEGVLRRLLLGSTAERLLRRTTRPVLVVRQVAHEPYRRVMVAVDFSPWTVQAVALARRVAPHAHLVLLTAFRVPFEEKLQFAGVDAGTIAHYRQQARAEAVQRVHALAQAAGLKAGHWTPCVVEGEASLRIVEQEQEHGSDLVVLGKHGQSAAEDLLLGSVTQHVLAEGSTDVLVSTAHGA